jgi:uncharacterized damage-inducible protein DinB
MNAHDYLITQIESMWYLQESACQDLTNDLLVKLPPGTVSPIGVIWLHMVNSQDNFVSTITGKPPLWKSHEWPARFGVQKAPKISEDWSQYSSMAFTVEILREYSDDVRENVLKVLAHTDENSLDETVKFFTENDPKANVWALMVGHTLLHCGEIAAIKGVLGGKGLPF